MKSLKVFLSHPMSDIPEDEVMTLRNDTERYLRAVYKTYDKIEIIDNYHHDNAPPDAGRLWHLGASIQLLENIDIVCFCGKWQHSKGCIVEHEICVQYHIPYITL